MSADPKTPVLTDRELEVVLRALSAYSPSADDDEMSMGEYERLCDERDSAHMKAATAARARGMKLE